jgi:cytochrome c556
LTAVQMGAGASSTAVRMGANTFVKDQEIKMNMIKTQEYRLDKLLKGRHNFDAERPKKKKI